MIKKLEQGVKYVQKLATEDIQNEAVGVVLLSLLLTLNVFHTLF